MASTIEAIRQQMATKYDINRLKVKLETETAAVREDVEQVHLRLDGIQRTLPTRLDQMET